MKRIILSIMIILSPILASQNAVASLLPCEKMLSESNSSIHAGHQMDSAEMTQMNESDSNCVCDLGDCLLSHHTNAGTLFSSNFIDNVYAPNTLTIPFKPQVIFGVYTALLRPPIS